MIDAIDMNLKRGVKLLNNISDHVYRDKSVAPYHSSIGTHMRHVLDMFTCVFDGIDDHNIDLSSRRRNSLAEEKVNEGIKYFNEVLVNLSSLKQNNFNQEVFITDDLGLGKVTTKSTLGGILIQAHSHAIHHYASVGYIIHQLGVDLPDTDFGFNPTTQKS